MYKNKKCKNKALFLVKISQITYCEGENRKISFAKFIQEISSHIKNFTTFTASAAVQGKIFERLFKAAEINKLTEKEMETYNKSILEYEDVRSAVDFAFDNGVVKGVSQGITQGILEGKKETARNMLDMKIPVADIAKATGLTPEEIINL